MSTFCIRKELFVILCLNRRINSALMSLFWRLSWRRANSRRWLIDQLDAVLGNLVLFWTFSLPTTPRYCVFCIGCCCYHCWFVHIEKSRTSTVSEAEGDLDLLYTLWITTRCCYPSSSSSFVVSTWSVESVAASRDLFMIEYKKKKNLKQTFPYLNFALMKCQTLLEVSVGTESRVLRMKRQTEHGGKLWC